MVDVSFLAPAFDWGTTGTASGLFIYLMKKAGLVNKLRKDVDELQADKKELLDAIHNLEIRMLESHAEQTTKLIDRLDSKVDSLRAEFRR